MQTNRQHLNVNLLSKWQKRRCCRSDIALVGEFGEFVVSLSARVCETGGFLYCTTLTMSHTKINFSPVLLGPAEINLSGHSVYNQSSNRVPICIVLHSRSLFSMSSGLRDFQDSELAPILYWASSSIVIFSPQSFQLKNIGSPKKIDFLLPWQSEPTLQLQLSNAGQTQTFESRGQTQWQKHHFLLRRPLKRPRARHPDYKNLAHEERGLKQDTRNHGYIIGSLKRHVGSTVQTCVRVCMGVCVCGWGGVNIHV